MSVRIAIVVSAASPDMVRSEPTTVRQIRWVGATTAGHTVVILDADDNLLWDSEATGANYVECDTELREWPSGFKVTTMGSGGLRIYTENNKQA